MKSQKSSSMLAKPKTAALEDATPSSHLTPIKDSSNLKMSSAFAQHLSAATVPQRQTKKPAAKRKLTHATEEEGSETESRPKRQKPPSSDSSMEISEVQPAPKPSPAASKGKAVKKSVSGPPLKTRSQSKKAQKPKSKPYVVDSEDDAEGVEGAQELKEQHKQDIGE